MKYKAIIFDLFGVIVNEIGIEWLKQKFPLDVAIEIDGKYGPPLDKEEITVEEYFSILGNLTRLESEQIQNEWYSLVKINRDVVVLIETLKKKNFKMILLTNAYRKLLEHVVKEGNLARLFNEVVTSFEEKLVKPDPRIFKITLDRAGIDAGEAIFIDDRERNVKAGEELGIRSILFKDANSLEAELKKLGIINEVNA